MPDEYYNTNAETGTVLADSYGQAKQQRQMVQRWFEQHPDHYFAPHQIPMPSGTPLTSVRRAVTNLTEQGVLEKTDRMVAGTYGKQVHTWRLASGQLEMFGVAS
jgi:DNA-binding IclR family transcriptional regulator